MKQKRWLILTTGAALSLILAGTAIANTDATTYRESRLERMTEALELNPEQRADIEALMKERMEQREQMREEMKTQLATILTPEQLERHQAMRERHNEKHKGRHCKE